MHSFVSITFISIQMYLRMATVLLELLTVVILVVASNDATYSVTDSVSGSGFLSAFSHESIVTFVGRLF